MAFESSDQRLRAVKIVWIVEESVVRGLHSKGSDHLIQMLEGGWIVVRELSTKWE